MLCPALAGLLLSAVVGAGFVGSAAAAPLTFSQSAVEKASAESFVIKTVTRAGVAHRSTRRTARRVERR